MAIKCIGFITDPHIPYHDNKALSCALSVLKDSKISELFLGGDVLDQYWCHDHGPKHPDIVKGFFDEAAEGNKFLDLIDREWPTIPKHFIEGNHENRFERYIIKNCYQIFGLTELSKILRIDKDSQNPRLFWKWYPFRTGQLIRVQNTDLYLKHAPKGSSGPTIINASACNLGFGHIHRIIDEHKVSADGRRIHVWSPGWLGDVRFDKVFGYVPGHWSWQQGFARIWIDDVTNQFWVDIHQIKDGKCIVDGKIYRG